MIPAPTHTREAERLKALADYHVLDSAPEDAFDDLAKLAGQICGCPISLITLIDEKRQWFKARVGLEMSETPREESFCAHAILDSMNLMIVPDATHDKRFADNPLVTSNPNIRFYAGAPLLTPGGLPVGSLCVIDRQPRQLAPEQFGALRIIGRQVSHMLELRRVSRALAQALNKPDAHSV
jgi:GAF domain-containing protein